MHVTYQNTYGNDQNRKRLPLGVEGGDSGTGSPEGFSNNGSDFLYIKQIESKCGSLLRSD